MRRDAELPAIPPELVTAAELCNRLQHHLIRDGRQQMAAALLVAAWLLQQPQPTQKSGRRQSVGTAG